LLDQRLLLAKSETHISIRCAAVEECRQRDQGDTGFADQPLAKGEVFLIGQLWKFPPSESKCLRRAEPQSPTGQPAASMSRLVCSRLRQGNRIVHLMRQAMRTPACKRGES
jgi:hypothetical protein